MVRPCERRRKPLLPARLLRRDEPTRAGGTKLCPVRPPEKKVAKAAVDGIARQHGAMGVDVGALAEAPAEPVLEEEAPAA